MPVVQVYMYKGRTKDQQLSINAGGVRIEIAYRYRGSDAGLSFEVYGGKENEALEVLRFDCFKKRPHFHSIGPTRNKLERIDKKAAPDPVRWTLSRIKSDLSSMIWKAGHRKLAKEIDQTAVTKAVAKAEKEILRLLRQKGTR